MLGAAVLLGTASVALVPLSPTTRPAVAQFARARPLHSVAVAPSLAAQAVGKDAWAADLDYKGFRKEVHELGQRLGEGQNMDDVRHLKKMILWSNAFGALGVSTMWMSSPIGRLLSIIGLSTWTCTRWTMIGHHISHGGYNRQDTTGRFTTFGFAVGSVYRRARDWFDWMLPEAWNIEHNNLHHYRLGESGDPDLVERNLEIMRTFPLPRAVKYLAVAGLAAMWKCDPRSLPALPCALRRLRLSSLPVAFEQVVLLRAEHVQAAEDL